MRRFRRWKKGGKLIAIVEATLSLTGEAEHLHLLGPFGRTRRTTPQEQAPPCPFVSGSPRVSFGFHGFVPKIIPTGDNVVRNISPCHLQQPPRIDRQCKRSGAKGSPCTK